MIKAFRNIRQKLLHSGKLKSYMAYAIGEIALVMIGILLALQVNNWNQTRLQRTEESNILSNLHTEFLENKIELDKSTAIFNGAYNANLTLMNLVGSDVEELKKHNLDSILYESLPSIQIVFSDNVIKDVLQSGRLHIIQDQELIQLIHQWEAQILLIKERESQLELWINNQLMPYLLDYVSFKQTDDYGKMPWGGKSKLKTNYYQLFQQLKYEGLIDNTLWYHNKNKLSLETANELIKKIIRVTEKH